MVDKTKGAGKLFSRVFVMLFALMFLPPLLFSGFGSDGGGALIPRAQRAFLPVVPKIILGADVGNNVSDTVDYTTKSIIKSTLRTFFQEINLPNYPHYLFPYVQFAKEKNSVPSPFSKSC